MRGHGQVRERVLRTGPGRSGAGKGAARLQDGAGAGGRQDGVVGRGSVGTRRRHGDAGTATDVWPAEARQRAARDGHVAGGAAAKGVHGPRDTGDVGPTAIVQAAAERVDGRAKQYRRHRGAGRCEPYCTGTAAARVDGRAKVRCERHGTAGRRRGPAAGRLAGADRDRQHGQVVRLPHVPVDVRRLDRVGAGRVRGRAHHAGAVRRRVHVRDRRRDDHRQRQAGARRVVLRLRLAVPRAKRPRAVQPCVRRPPAVLPDRAVRRRLLSAAAGLSAAAVPRPCRDPVTLLARGYC